MAIIPGEEQYNGIPSPRSGKGIARIDTTAQQEGAAALGAGIASFGNSINALAQKVQAKRLETAAYDTEARFQQFRFAEAQRFGEDQRNVPAGGAAEYADQWTAGYRERARAFFQTIPEPLRRDYDLKLFATEREFYANGLEFEQAEMRRFSVKQIEDTLNNAVLPQVIAARDATDPDRALQEAISAGTRLINDNPHLTPTEKDAGVQAWRERSQRAFIDGLPPEERAGWLGTAPEDVAERIIQIESDGDPNATNPNSSATGLGQFIEETWLGLLSRYRPEIAENPEYDREALLALRSDPALSREMVVNLTAENTTYLRDRGIDPTPANIYLAHFLGPAGAVAVLSADPRLAMSSIVSDGVIAANRSVMEGRTASDVIAWATDKMNGTRGTSVNRMDAIPFEDRQALTVDAAAEITRQRNAMLAAENAQYAAQLNQLLVGIHDGNYGLAQINDARETWLTDYSDITRVEQAFEDANKGQLDLSAALRDYNNPDYIFSQWDESDRDKVDLLYGAQGGTTGLLVGDDPAARTDAMLRLQTIVQRTGVIPGEALSQLRTGLYSQNEEARSAAFVVMDGLYRAHPALVENTLNDQDLTRLQRYQELAPITTPEQLNAILNPSQDPRDVARRDTLRTEARPLAAAIPTSTILQAFDPNVLPGNQPLEPLEPGMQAALRRDFELLYAENYALTANPEVSQRLALQGLAMKWGATSIGPDNRLMPYPPENYYPPVDNSYDWMEESLRNFVEERYGTDTQDWGVVPSPITEAHLEPTTDANGVTHYAPYDVWVIDADGVVRIERNMEFPYVQYREAARAEWEANRVNMLRDQRFDERFPDAPPPTGRDGPLVPIVEGTGNVPIEFNEFGIPVTRGTPTTQQQADAEYRQQQLREAEIRQRGQLFREQARIRAAETPPSVPTLP